MRFMGEAMDALFGTLSLDGQRLSMGTHACVGS